MPTLKQCRHTLGNVDVQFQNSVDAKDWIFEQEAIKPLQLSLPKHDRVALKLEESGFVQVTVEQVGEHPVYLIRGRVGSSGCRSEIDLRRAFHKLAKILGFQFRAADTAVTYRRGRFQVALCL